MRPSVSHLTARLACRAISSSAEVLVSIDAGLCMVYGLETVYSRVLIHVEQGFSTAGILSLPLGEVWGFIGGIEGL